MTAILSPLLVTCVVVASYVIFYSTFIKCGGSPRQCEPLNMAYLLNGVRFNAVTSAAGYVGRTMWMLSNGVNTLACCAALLAGGMVIYKSLLGHRERTRLLLIALIIAFAANLSLLVSLWASYDTAAPAPTLLRATAAREVYQLNTFNRIFDTLGLTAAVTLAFAACSVLWRRRSGGGGENVASLARRVRLLRIVLYTGAVMLVMGVLRLSVLLNWGVSYLPEGSPEAKVAAGLVTGIVSSLGGFYTLIIAGIYLPAALVLRERARALAEDEPPEQRERWLEQHGVTLSFLDNLPRLVAILGPLLAGPIGDLIARLAKATAA